MRPSKLAQPYRQSAQRGPSDVLTAMRAGKMKGAPGASLMHASNQMRRKRPGGTRLIPR